MQSRPISIHTSHEASSQANLSRKTHRHSRDQHQPRFGGANALRHLQVGRQIADGTEHRDRDDQSVERGEVGVALAEKANRLRPIIDAFRPLL